MGRGSPKVWAGVALIVLLVVVDVALILWDSGPVPAPPAASPEEAAPADDRRWRIPKEALDAVLRDLQEASPDVTFSSTPALTVQRLAPDSPLTLAGLRPKDRIVSINGTPVQGKGSEELLREAAGARSFKMKVERGGQLMDYRFDFE